MKLKHSFLIACLGATPLCAQQVNTKTDVKQAEKSESASGEARASATATSNSNGNVKTETRTSDSKSNRRPPQPNQPNQPSPLPPAPEQKPVAYIGVLTREVSADLRSQFSLPEGFGLLVDEVMPDSPAKTAGLKVHDILVKFEDQQLVSMEQLMILVRAKKKGEVANLTVITGGKETKVPVTLGERMVAANDQRSQHGFGGWQQMAMPFGGGGGMEQMQRGMRDMSGDVREQMEHFQKELHEYQQRIQDWSKAGGTTPMPQPPNFNVPGQQHQRGDRHNGPPQQGNNAPRDGGVQFQTSIDAHTEMNITRRDDAGEYSIKREDGKTIFSVHPNNGKEQSWPVNNDEERKAVPEEFRDKLRMMDGAGSGIHIEVHPGPGGEVPGNPGPRDGGGNPAQPRPKGRTTSV